MTQLETMGWISLVPVLIAIVLALATKDTIISLAIACICGCFLAGKGIFGFTDLIQSALGNADFIWAAMNILLFGTLVAFFEKSGAIDGFTRIVQKKKLSRKGVQLAAWFLGLFCFADSMSPLFVGSVMRKLSDKAKISREKLAYIADSTAAPVSILYPFTGWSAYLTSLAVGFGCLTTREEAFSVMLRAIPMNAYAIISVFLVALIGLGIIKDFGPMKKAEKRAAEEGKLVADGAVPMYSGDSEVKPAFDNPRVVLNFIVPTILLVAIAIGTFIVIDSVKVVEAAMIVIVLMCISFMFQGMKLQELSATIIAGIKNSMPALMVLAVAYPLNALSKEMGTANFIINATQSFLSPKLLPFSIFVISAILSFATGTSWGTFAIMMPMALPLAFNATGDVVTPLVVACFAAVGGGGLFGDHCSPLSDTTIMASMGAGADHVDHVKTQFPYAFVAATITSAVYLIIGFIYG